MRLDQIGRFLGNLLASLNGQHGARLPQSIPERNNLLHSTPSKVGQLCLERLEFVDACRCFCWIILRSFILTDFTLHVHYKF